ncbi:MAG: hypothetical protein ACLFQV_12940 [Vulcanimicrobiota bacterium]
MIQFEKTSLKLNHKFDPKSTRHYINGHQMVLHCHHYLTLYTQLAMDCDFFDAKSLLAECMEETTLNILKQYYNDNKITALEDKIKIAELHYAAFGLGKIYFETVGDFSGQVKLTRSHIDEGWLKKWGEHGEPVNYVTAGFIAAAFSAFFDRPARSFKINETVSMVTGGKSSVFQIVSL